MSTMNKVEMEVRDWLYTKNPTLKIDFSDELRRTLPLDVGRFLEIKWVNEGKGRGDLYITTTNFNGEKHELVYPRKMRRTVKVKVQDYFWGIFYNFSSFNFTF